MEPQSLNEVFKCLCDPSSAISPSCLFTHSSFCPHLIEKLSHSLVGISQGRNCGIIPCFISVLGTTLTCSSTGMKSSKHKTSFLKSLSSYTSNLDCFSEAHQLSFTDFKELAMHLCLFMSSQLTLPSYFKWRWQKNFWPRHQKGAGQYPPSLVK